MTTTHKFTVHPVIDRGCGCYLFPLSCSCGWETVERTVNDAGQAIDRHYRTRNAA